MIVNMCQMSWLYLCVDLGDTTVWYFQIRYVQIRSIIFYGFAILKFISICLT